LTCVNARPRGSDYKEAVTCHPRQLVAAGWVLFLACAQVPAAVSAGAPAATEAPEVTVDNGALAIRFQGRPLLVYAFATNQFKPYVRELYTLRGDNVLRDAPADHLHHHGLMYAVRVNDVNFWEEGDQPGHQIPVKLISHRVGATRYGLPEASFTQLIHWVAHTNATRLDSTPVALLVERRTLTLTVDEPRAEVALRWQADFEAGPGAESVKLQGSGYNGLGLRLPADWDHSAHHANSENAPYSAEQTWDVTPARWAAVSHSGNSGAITVMLAGRPSNPGDTRFFSMLNPFAYLSVTQNLEKAPLAYARGDRFHIDYLLLLYAGETRRDFLEQRYGSWVSRTQDAPSPRVSSTSTQPARP
jgi:hypothetical protein